MATSDEEMMVVNSLRQAFETYGGPGSSVNATQNPFFIQLTGQFDLSRAAKLVLANLATQRAHKEQIAKEEAAQHLRKAQAALATAAQETKKAVEPDPLT